MENIRGIGWNINNLINMLYKIKPNFAVRARLYLLFISKLFHFRSIIFSGIFFISSTVLTF